MASTLTETPRLRQRLGALALSFAIIGAMGEAAARLSGGAPWPEREPLLTVRSNPARGWEMQPGEHYTYDKLVRVNSLGLRGPEVPDKAEGERRVLVLGDSFAYGQGVAEEHTVAARLEAELRPGLPAEPVVINGGHRAYGTAQEIGLLRELGPRIRPDDVLVLYFWNDSVEHDLAAQARRLLESGPIAFDVGEPMEGWARVRWYGRQLLRRSALIMCAYDLVRGTGDRAKKYPFDPDDYRVRFARHLAELQRLTDELGARLHFAIIPDPFGAGAGHPSSAVEAVVRGVLAEAHVEPIELEHRLREWIGDGPLPVIPYDGHYLPSAYEVMGRALAEGLRQGPQG